MVTEISPPILTESTNYELWKLETLAWTVVTELSKEKQAIVVALGLPDDKRKIKEKVFNELDLAELNSENGVNNLFEFLDRYLLEDELINCWNKFEDFENFERKQGENIREYVANFDLKLSKLKKLNMKLPSEILALKLLRKANLSQQERMIVLTGVNYADKGNMYKDTKESLIKFMGDQTEGKARTRLDVKLEPAWRNLTSSSNKPGHVQHGKNEWLKKKLNPLGSDGKVLLCHSCGSYRHLMAECPDSWENMVKRKASESDVKLRAQSKNDILKIEENWRMKPLGLEEKCGVSVSNKQLAEEEIKLTAEIRNLKAEIKEIKVVKDKELRRPIEKQLHHERILDNENEGQQNEQDTTVQELIQFITKLKEEDSSRAFQEMKEKLLTKKSLSKNNQYNSGILEKEIEVWKAVEHNKEKMKHLGTDDHDRQASKKETKTKGIHHELDGNNGRTKTIAWISENQMKQKVNTDKNNQVKHWFWWPVERQQLNDMALQMTAWNLGFKTFN